MISDSLQMPSAYFRQLSLPPIESNFGQNALNTTRNVSIVGNDQLNQNSLMESLEEPSVHSTVSKQRNTLNMFESRHRYLKAYQSMPDALLQESIDEAATSAGLSGFHITDLLK